MTNINRIKARRNQYVSTVIPIRIHPENTTNDMLYQSHIVHPEDESREPKTYPEHNPNTEIRGNNPEVHDTLPLYSQDE